MVSGAVDRPKADVGRQFIDEIPDDQMISYAWHLEDAAPLQCVFQWQFWEQRSPSGPSGVEQMVWNDERASLKNNASVAVTLE